jgi:hypothetical protein
VLEVELLVLEMALRRRSQPPSKPVRFSSCAVGFGWKGRPHSSSRCGISTAKRYIHLWTNASNRAEASMPSTNSGGLPNIRQHILTTPSGDPYLCGEFLSAVFLVCQFANQPTRNLARRPTSSFKRLGFAVVFTARHGHSATLLANICATPGRLTGCVYNQRLKSSKPEPLLQARPRWIGSRETT